MLQKLNRQGRQGRQAIESITMSCTTSARSTCVHPISVFLPWRPRRPWRFKSLEHEPRPRANLRPTLPPWRPRETLAFNRWSTYRTRANLRPTFLLPWRPRETLAFNRWSTYRTRANLCPDLTLASKASWRFTAGARTSEPLPRPFLLTLASKASWRFTAGARTEHERTSADLLFLPWRLRRLGGSLLEHAPNTSEPLPTLASGASWRFTAGARTEHERTSAHLGV